MKKKKIREMNRRILNIDTNYEGAHTTDRLIANIEYTVDVLNAVFISRSSI